MDNILLTYIGLQDQLTHTSRSKFTCTKCVQNSSELQMPRAWAAARYIAWQLIKSHDNCYWSRSVLQWSHGYGALEVNSFFHECYQALSSPWFCTGVTVQLMRTMSLTLGHWNVGQYQICRVDITLQSSLSSVANKHMKSSGLLSALCPMRGKMRLYELLGVRISVQSMW